MKDSILKKIENGDLVLVHGTNSSTVEKIISDGCLHGDGEQVWNVSDRWVYFWSNYGLFSEICFSTTTDYSDEVSDLSDMFSEIIATPNEYTEENLLKIKKVWMKIPLESRKELAKEMYDFMLLKAIENGRMSITKDSETTMGLFFFDGVSLEGLETDESCISESLTNYNNMEGAVRVPAPVFVEEECGFLGLVKEKEEPEIVWEERQELKIKYALSFSEYDIIPEEIESEYETIMNSISDLQDSEDYDSKEEEAYCLREEALLEYVEENLFRISQLRIKAQRNDNRISVIMDRESDFIRAITAVDDDMCWECDLYTDVEDLEYIAPEEIYKKRESEKKRDAFIKDSEKNILPKKDISYAKRVS